VNTFNAEPSRDGDESVTVVRDAEKLSCTTRNKIFKATHHVGEVILSMRVIPDNTKASIKHDMVPSEFDNCCSRLYEDRK
jgi:hypothetical protein